MQLEKSIFREKLLSFTVMQVILLSFLLFLSLVVHIFFNSQNYLEAYPLYTLVGFFFLLEMFQFFWLTREAGIEWAVVRRKYRRCLPWRLGLSVVACAVICLGLSTQPLFTSLLFFLFLLAEFGFDIVYYRRFI